MTEEIRANDIDEIADYNVKFMVLNADRINACKKKKQAPPIFADKDGRFTWVSRKKRRHIQKIEARKRKTA